MSTEPATDAPLYGPREKHFDVLDRVREERDRRKRQTKDGTRSWGFANLPAKNGNGWDLNPKRSNTRFQTIFNFHDGTKRDKIILVAYNNAEVQINLQLKDEFENAQHNSLHNRQKRKAELLDANAEKRAKNLEMYGDNSDRERRLLNLWLPRCALRSLVFLVLMLATKADALFRTDALPPGMYMREQHKTCGKIIKVNAFGSQRYEFNSVTGYDGCIVVFECEEDNAVFWAYGDALNEAYKTRKSKQLKITISAKDGQPCLKKKPWLNYIGNGDEAKQKLPLVLERMCTEQRLPLCTMWQANEELGPSHATEEANIKRWIRVKYGGLARDDNPRWLQLKPHWQQNRHIYQLTQSGHVIAYPEDSQNGKTDLHVYSPEDGYVQKLMVQCKSARVRENDGLKVGMVNACGMVEKKKQKKNSYVDGDNDIYVVHYYDPETREFHYWEFTNAEMVAKRYIGEGAADGFSVYKQTNRISDAYRHAWTWEKHVCKTV